MRKLLLILAVISFALPLFYYHWAHSVVYEFQESNNYFVEVFDLMHYHIFNEGGLGLYPLYSVIFGVICLVILVIPFVADEIAFYQWKRRACGGCDVDDKETP